MTPAGYRPRLVETNVRRLMGAAGAVCIQGPKWCGKTWTGLSLANSAMMVADPAGGFQNRRLLSLDVGEALKGETPHLIDEWQEIPAIWDAVRSEVDRSPERGRFILTGSSTPRSKGVLHRGAGRIDAVGMRTMSLFESGDSDGRVSLASLFDQSFETVASGRAVTLDGIIGLAARGGWPGNIGVDPDVAVEHNAAYLSTVIDDAIQLFRSDAAAEDGRSEDPDDPGRRGRPVSRRKLEMTLRSLARNESTTASCSRIARDTADFGEAVVDKTVHRHLDLLDRLFLTEDQPAFDPNWRSEVRVGKGAKRHLADPSLAIAALGVNTVRLKEDLKTFGFMFEAMCERDLDIYARADGGTLSHYRDGAGREIDAVVEMPDGRWGAFEIKLGVGQVDAAAERLLSVRDAFESKGVERLPSVLAVVCGLESSAYRRPDGVYVLPITSLRNRSPPPIVGIWSDVDGIRGPPDLPKGSRNV